MGRIAGKKELITTKDFMPKFFDELKHGQILGFKDDAGETKHWRVARVWKAKRQAWIEPWELYDTIDAANNARDKQ